MKLTIMISARKINLEGLELYGNRPISPRTRAFCQEHDIQITQKDGVVSITRSFILSREEVDDFLRAKANSPAPTTPKMPSAATKLLAQGNLPQNINLELQEKDHK